MNTKAILLVLTTLVSITTIYPEDLKESKINSWLEGYLYESKHFIETIRLTNTFKIEVYGYTPKRKLLREKKITQIENTVILLDIVYADLLKSTKEKNIFDNEGNHVNSGPFYRSFESTLEVSWDLAGREAYFKISGRELSCNIRSKSRKESDIFIERVPCSLDLENKILKMLQPDGGEE